MLPRHRKLHLESLEPRRLLDASLPQINEFLAVNDDVLADEDDDDSDWIEIYNPGPDSVDLNGWRLIDEAARRALEAGFSDLAVISAVGTRPYYRRLGFTDGRLYQHRSLT